MTRQNVAIARSRAVEDAIAGRYDNREQSQRGRVAYDTKHAQLSRAMESLGPALGTDWEVHKAELS